MPNISRQQIHHYSVGVTQAETNKAQSLLNRNKVVVNESNVDIFRMLTALPNCKELRCINLGLTELPALPQCSSLSCSGNQLTELPAIPQCEILQCTYNQLTELPALPLCKTLNCRKNQLTKLPALPQCLNLNCSYNQITQLPELPNCVELDCSYNQITVIPPLPHCPDPIIDNNPILPVLPPALYQTNRAWWNSQQQRQLKQQIKHQLTQQQKRQIQRTDFITSQQFINPVLGDDFAIYENKNLYQVISRKLRGMKGLDVTRSLPLKQAVQKFKTQQDQAKKRIMKKDIAKYVALLQMLQTYGLEDLFGNQF